ncbi:hypothetical protein JCM8208_000483 [Rhodotorula glutinis]
MSMATAALEHCLATSLATNDAVPASLAHLVSLLSSQRILALAEHHEGIHGPLLHRWQLRILALVAPVNPPPVRTAGFHLAHLSFQASTSLLLDAAKGALTAAVQVLNNPKADPDLFLAALELARLVLAKSTYHPEWARDNVGPQQVQKIVGALVQAATVEFSDVKLPCVAAIVSLLPLYPTALRPLAPSLHNLAVALIAESSGHAAVVDQGAALFASLYLLAPKGKEGLREAWKTGVEALVGSIDALTTHVTAGVFAEDTTFNHTLSPLALPPLASDSPTAALVRLESLTSVLLAVLRTPTTEKAGLVPLPLGALVELSIRLVALSSLTPVRERTDPALLTSVLALVVPRTQLAGARLAAQLALASGPHLAPHAGAVLGALSATLNAYAPREPMRPVLSGAYALVVEQLGSGVDPDEAKKSLARVWRTVLEDIGGVAVEPVVVGAGAGAGAAGGKEAGKGGNGRKAKRQKTYDPSESMATRRVALDEVDMQIAECGLATLERLLRCPFSHFLPPALQLATARLLLYLSLSPAFSVVHPLASTSTSFYPSTSALSPLDIARQSPTFRRAVLAALVAALSTSTCAPSGTHERAAEVFRRASLLSTDADARNLALEGLALVRAFAHPAVPAQQPNAGLARVRHEAKGGWVGDEQEWDRSAREFGIRVDERRVDEDGSSSDDDDEISGAEEDARGARNGTGEAARRRKSPPAPAVVLAPAPAQTAFPATTAFAAPSFAVTSAAKPAQQNGFAAFSAPAFGASTSSAASSGKVQLDEVASVHSFAPSTGVTVGTLDVETVPASAAVAKTTRAAAVKAAAVDSDDEDEDEGMPMIDVGSEEE